MSPRDQFEACMRHLDAYHFVQCLSHSPNARCTCGLHKIKSAIRESFNAAESGEPPHMSQHRYPVYGCPACDEIAKYRASQTATRRSEPT